MNRAVFDVPDDMVDRCITEVSGCVIEGRKVKVDRYEPFDPHRPHTLLLYTQGERKETTVEVALGLPQSALLSVQLPLPTERVKSGGEPVLAASRDLGRTPSTLRPKDRQMSASRLPHDATKQLVMLYFTGEPAPVDVVIYKERAFSKRRSAVITFAPEVDVAALARRMQRKDFGEVKFETAPSAELAKAGELQTLLHLVLSDDDAGLLQVETPFALPGLSEARRERGDWDKVERLPQLTRRAERAEREERPLLPVRPPEGELVV